MDLSILVPAIRVANWQLLYHSINASFSGSWELVLISPYDLPEPMKQYNNIKHIKSWGSPIRCRQIGLLQCSGKWICYAADDVIFIKGSLDIAFSKLKKSHMEYRTVIVGKYVEGTDDIEHMLTNTYYLLGYHDSLKKALKEFPQNYLLINTGIISKLLLFKLGGWDCRFEVCAMACVDLSVRIQNFHAVTLLQDEPIFSSTHLPATTGDHKPIHDAQIEHDEGLFNEIYSEKDSINRTNIPLDNWKDAPERWERRFGKKV